MTTSLMTPFHTLLDAQDWQGAMEEAKRLRATGHEQAGIECLRDLGLRARAHGQRGLAIVCLSEILPFVRKAEEQAFVYAVLSEMLGDAGDHAQANLHGEKALQINDQQAMHYAPRKRLLAFSLYGGKPEYCENAVLNADLMPEIYPGWRMRVYYDDTVPAHTVQRLAARQVELVQAQTLHLPAQVPGTFWRFLALEDLDCEVVLLRDIDSLISARERALVDEWLATDKPFHIIRDWYSQTDLILAGMWGVRHNLLCGIRLMLDAFLRATPQLHPTHADQHFLARMVWPRIKPYMVHHSSCFSAHGARWPAAQPRIFTNEYGHTQQMGAWSLSHYSMPVQSDCLYMLYEGERLLAQYQCKAGQSLELPRAYRARIEAGRYRLVPMPFSVAHVTVTPS